MLLTGFLILLPTHESLLEELGEGNGKVVAANGGTMDIVAWLYQLWPICSGQECVAVSDVQLIPELTANLLSISKIVEKGYSVTFRDTGCEVYNGDGVVVATGKHENNQFKLEQTQRRGNVMVCGATRDGVGSLELWHKRLGHLSVRNVETLANGVVDGMKVSAKEIKDCRVCPMGKQSRLPFGSNVTRTSEILELVHSDISGPMEVNSHGGNRFYVSFIDDITRRMTVYFLKTKSEDELLSAFKNFHALAERQSGKKLKTIRTDNGKEYTNRGFQQYLSSNGIRHEMTNDYTPKQNGMAERANRTIVEKARCMLYEAGLPKSFWAEAVSTAIYSINRSPTKGHKVTPEEAWTGRKVVYGQPHSRISMYRYFERRRAARKMLCHTRGQSQLVRHQVDRAVWIVGHCVQRSLQSSLFKITSKIRRTCPPSTIQVQERVQ